MNEATSQSTVSMNRQRTIKITYLLAIIRGVVYPIFKVSLIALADKVLREALENSVDSELFSELEEEVFGSIENSGTTRLFLMASLSFKATFAVVLSIVSFLAVIQPLGNAIMSYHLCYDEVKRLQHLIYKRFILEPNSVPIKEASELLYTKIAVIEEYWSKSKFHMYGDRASVITCLIMILVLSWDLGLIYLGASAIIFVGVEMLRSWLTNPWAAQRESKTAKTNAFLIDLVICKEVILTNARELEEQKNLEEHLKADQTDCRQLWKADVISEFLKLGTFYSVTPMVFLYVFLVDLTLERFFQLLLIMVLTDEMVRSYLAMLEQDKKKEEFERAQRNFCEVLDLNENDLFPQDFEWGLGTWKEKRSPVGETTEQTYGHHAGSAYFASTPASSSILEHEGKIEFKNLSIGYTSSKGNTCTVAENLSLSFGLEQRYAIMGESGAGKSTVLKTLAGLVRPLKGEVRLSGETFKTTSFWWRQQIGVVSQDSVFFNRSLRENLCYGLNVQEMKTDDEILHALDKVHLKDLILLLPEGLDTCFEQNGQEFSGGQRQRLQIARLLLTSHKIVLMDEPTSSLDSATANSILNTLNEFLKGKTLIMVTHDLQPLMLAKTIVNMKVGGDIEYGFRESLRQSLKGSVRMSLLDGIEEVDVHVEEADTIIHA